MFLTVCMVCNPGRPWEDCADLGREGGLLRRLRLPARADLVRGRRMFAEAGNHERPSVSRAAITSEAARKVCSCEAPSATMWRRPVRPGVS